VCGDLTSGYLQECVDVGKRVADVRGDQPLRQAPFLHFVRDAIWAVAKALDDMHIAYCGRGVHGLCRKMRHVKGVDLRERLMQVQFKGNELSHKQLHSQCFAGAHKRYRIFGRSVQKLELF